MNNVLILVATSMLLFVAASARASERQSVLRILCSDSGDYCKVELAGTLDPSNHPGGACMGDEIYWSANNTMSEYFLRIAMAAALSGRTLQIQGAGCREDGSTVVGWLRLND